MPKVKHYKFKFQHNESFHNDIKNKLGNYIDWQITSLFYSLIHLINGYAKKYYSHEPVSHHNERQRFVDHHLHNFLRGYEDLRDDCDTVRYYDCSDCSLRKQRLDNIHKPYFDSVKKFIENQL